jgi:hypothetical protein
VVEYCVLVIYVMSHSLPNIDRRIYSRSANKSSGNDHVRCGIFLTSPTLYETLTPMRAFFTKLEKAKWRCRWREKFCMFASSGKLHRSNHVRDTYVFALVFSKCAQSILRKVNQLLNIIMFPSIFQQPCCGHYAFYID